MEHAQLLQQNPSLLDEPSLNALLDASLDPQHPLDLRVSMALHAYYGLRRRGAFKRLLSNMEVIWLQAAHIPSTQRFELGVSLASVQSEIGLLSRALTLLEEMFAEFTAPMEQFKVAYYAFYCTRRVHDLDGSQRWLDAMNAAPIEQPPPRIMSYRHLCQASLAEDRGQYKQAREAFTLALHFAQAQPGHPDEVVGIIASTQLELARLVMCAGEFEQSRLMCEDTSEQVVGVDAHVQAYAHLYHGMAALGAGHLELAHMSLQLALRAGAALPLPRTAAHAALYLAWHAILTQQPAEARRALRECARHDAAGDHSCTPWIAPLQRLLACYDPDERPPQAHDAGSVIDALRLRWLAGGERLPAPPQGELLEPLVRMAHALLGAGPAPMRLSADGAHLWTHDQQHDLSKRGPLRRILAALVAARRSDQPWRSTVDLFEAGWPELDEVPANGFRRVYTELHRLKEWGVEVASGELGYCLRALPVSA